jgi:trehalose 6-phosphate synthase/phosphatase
VYLKKGTLFVVSNRLPISIRSEGEKWEMIPSSGGLASALIGVKEKIPFKWIGWPGTSFLANQKKEVEQKLGESNLYPIFINKEQEEHYYHTICNSFLWPLFHYFTDHMLQSTDSWHFYQEINQLFADKVIELAEEGASVWVHDFHLMLVPRMLKEKRPDLKIGFFLHIPFPSSEIYRMLPQRKELLQGMLAADYIGFQTKDYAKHFTSTCLRVLGLSTDRDNISYQGKKVRIGVHPIGMNIKSFEEILSKPKYCSYIQEIKERYQTHLVILGIERLDYTKGIFFKLKAFEKLLEQSPELIGKVILLQIIVPCRLDSPEYQKHRAEVEKMVSRINGKFSKPGFNPIHYMYRHLPLDELIAIYCLANVCMVTSTRDGMNLVAQEYVYCSQRAQTKGCLILSEFAGAAQHLPHALIVNPFDIEAMSHTLKLALELLPEEKERNLNRMIENILHLDSPIWGENFLSKMHEAALKNAENQIVQILTQKESNKLVELALQSKKITLFLDYDGTLREITAHPMDATPSKEVLELIRHLADLKEVDVHIVSGRDHHTLQRWFGDLPIHLSAEHGFLMRKSNQENWNSLKEIDLSWVPYVKKILKRAVEEVPGSFLETKSSVLSWHYRLADVNYGEWRANELYSSLIQELANLPVEIVPGKYVLEVRAQGVSKAKYVQQILDSYFPNHFILCIGDDRTDHDMYQALPENAISIHVGEHSVKTSYHLNSPVEVCDLLQKIYLALSESQQSKVLD